MQLRKAFRKFQSWGLRAVFGWCFFATILNASARTDAALDTPGDRVEIVAAPSACRVTKLLAQVDLGEGFAENPAGTSNRLAIFFPSQRFRAGVLCEQAEPGWSIGFIQGVSDFEYGATYSTGDLRFPWDAGLVADTIRTSTGAFRAVVGKKSLASSTTPTEIEHEDQPRFVVPWVGEHGDKPDSSLNAVSGKFSAVLYVVMFHESTNRLAPLRRVVWNATVHGKCDSRSQTCAMLPTTRNAIVPEKLSELAFPREMLREPTANSLTRKTTWTPKTQR